MCHAITKTGQFIAGFENFDQFSDVSLRFPSANWVSVYQKPPGRKFRADSKIKGQDNLKTKIYNLNLYLCFYMSKCVPLPPRILYFR